MPDSLEMRARDEVRTPVTTHLTNGALASRLDRIRQNIRSFSPAEREAFLAEAAWRLEMRVPLGGDE
jgi:hypothetical protein